MVIDSITNKCFRGSMGRDVFFIGQDGKRLSKEETEDCRLPMEDNWNGREIKYCCILSSMDAQALHICMTCTVALGILVGTSIASQTQNIELSTIVPIYIVMLVGSVASTIFAIFYYNKGE